MAETLEGISSKVYQAIVTVVDHRMLEIKVTRQDFDELKGVVRELAEAQKRTETEVRELAKDIRGLTRSHKDLQRQVGGISNTIGYELEDKSYPILPALLKRDFGAEVGRLYRRFLLYPDGRDDEINIYGEGKRNGQKVYVIGEAKAQLGRRDVDRFVRMLKRVQAFLDAELIPLVLTYAAHPKVEEYAATKGLKIYWSYDLQQPAI